MRFGFEWGKTPLAVAEPGPLIEWAVYLAGDDGLTLVEIRNLLNGLGKDRVSRGLEFARGSSVIEASEEARPNAAGQMQSQVVLRAIREPDARGDDADRE